MTRHASLQAMLARRERLSAEDEARVAAHLDECLDCQERADDYAAQVAFLRSFRREPAPPDLRDRLLTIIDRQTSASRVRLGWGAQEGPFRVATGLLQRVTLRWPGIALAAILPIAVIVLSPLVSQRLASPVSADQLLRAAAVASATPSRGTASVSYLGPETSLLADQVVPHQLTITWAISDAEHYRVEVETDEPAIDSGTLTMIQNGSSMTQYDTQTETASTRNGVPGGPDVSGLAGAAAPLGGVRPDQSIQQYLDSTQQDLPSSVPHFARILGQERLLGREVDIVQFTPVVRGIQCVPKGTTSTDCNTPLDYGTGTVWIDDATHLILKYQADLANPHSNVRSSLYQVTSLSLGEGASQAELAQQPPVAVQPVPGHGAIGTTTEVGGPPGHAPPVPHGFLAAPPPAKLPNADTSMETVATAPLGDTTGINLLFIPTDGQHFSPYVPGEHFLSVEERVRAHGLPPELQTGTPTQVGTCQAWAGTSANGLHTLAFARDDISVLITSDSLSAADLAAYAKTMCT